VAPHDGQAKHEPARCMMSPHTWHSTISTSGTRASAAPPPPAPTLPRDGCAADGARSSGGSRSIAGCCGVAAYWTPGSVGSLRSATVITPSSLRSSNVRYSTAIRRNR
jgi:hypothetical protein